MIWRARNSSYRYDLKDDPTRLSLPPSVVYLHCQWRKWSRVSPYNNAPINFYTVLDRTCRTQWMPSYCKLHRFNWSWIFPVNTNGTFYGVDIFFRFRTAVPVTKYLPQPNDCKALIPQSHIFEKRRPLHRPPWSYDTTHIQFNANNVNYI